MPRRKRTHKHLPARGRLRDMADTLWSIAVRSDWNNCCAVCGVSKCEAHHLVPRRHETTRYDLENGIALCATHHQFDPSISPHQNAAGWMSWLELHYPRVHQWYVENRYPETFEGSKSVHYYCGIIQGLQEYVEPEQFTEIVGQRFGGYLKESQL